jgi:TRAP-type C4-dicarboxylate transport system permease small subunit
MNVYAKKKNLTILENIGSFLLLAIVGVVHVYGWQIFYRILLKKSTNV